MSSKKCSLKWTSSSGHQAPVASNLKLNLTILMTNIDILEETMKVTQKEIDALNERINLEFNRRPLTRLQSNLLDIYLKQHRKVSKEYKAEYQKKNKMELELSRKVNIAVNEGAICIVPIKNQNKKIDNQSHTKDDDEKVQDQKSKNDKKTKHHFIGNYETGKCGIKNEDE